MEMVQGVVKILVYDGKKESVKLVKMDRSDDATSLETAFKSLVQDNKKKINQRLAIIPDRDMDKDF